MLKISDFSHGLRIFVSFTVESKDTAPELGKEPGFRVSGRFSGRECENLGRVPGSKLNFSLGRKFPGWATRPVAEPCTAPYTEPWSEIFLLLNDELNISDFKSKVTSEQIVFLLS